MINLLLTIISKGQNISRNDSNASNYNDSVSCYNENISNYITSTEKCDITTITKTSTSSSIDSNENTDNLNDAMLIPSINPMDCLRSVKATHHFSREFCMLI